jgi:hypothetical protein
MFRRTTTLSKIIKIFLYGIVNFVVVLALISITKFNSHGPIQGQLLPICIIIFVTGIIDYLIINKKF